MMRQLTLKLVLPCLVGILILNSCAKNEDGTPINPLEGMYVRTIVYNTEDVPDAELNLTVLNSFSEVETGEYFEVLSDGSYTLTEKDGCGCERSIWNFMHIMKPNWELVMNFSDRVLKYKALSYDLIIDFDDINAEGQVKTLYFDKGRGSNPGYNNVNTSGETFYKLSRVSDIGCCSVIPPTPLSSISYSFPTTFDLTDSRFEVNITQSDNPLVNQLFIETHSLGDGLLNGYFLSPANEDGIKVRYDFLNTSDYRNVNGEFNVQAESFDSFTSTTTSLRFEGNLDFTTPNITFTGLVYLNNNNQVHGRFTATKQ
jgi:hypothetical protein